MPSRSKSRPVSTRSAFQSSHVASGVAYATWMSAPFSQPIRPFGSCSSDTPRDSVSVYLSKVDSPWRKVNGFWIFILWMCSG